MPDDRNMHERIARCVELAIVRHGVPEADLEGTLDDADAILDELREPDEAMIAAGEDQLEKCDEDMDIRNYVSGVTTDWDYGMEAEAVFRAMLTAAKQERG